MSRVLALYRKSSYSPAQHRTNDTAILDSTLAHFAAAGWDVTRVDEAALGEAAADGAAADGSDQAGGPDASRALVPEADL